MVAKYLGHRLVSIDAGTTYVVKERDSLHCRLVDSPPLPEVAELFVLDTVLLQVIYRVFDGVDITGVVI